MLAEIGEHDCYHESELHSYEDAAPSKDMHIESLKEGIALLGFSPHQLKEHQEHLSHKYLASEL